MLHALARFGAPFVGELPAELERRPESVVYGLINAFRDAAAADGLDESYRLVVNGQSFDATAAVGFLRGGRVARQKPCLELHTSIGALAGARWGHRSLADAIAEGDATVVRGGTEELQRFERVFGLGQQASRTEVRTSQ